jgi:hypothetical protein
MTVWDGYADQPEDELEQSGWAESDDDQADGWKGEPDGEDDPFDPDGWRVGPMSPMKEMYREMLDEDDEDEPDDDDGA